LASPSLADIITPKRRPGTGHPLIDEGFGTLDEDTLTPSLDVLDSSRHDRTSDSSATSPNCAAAITQRLNIAKHIDGSTLTHLTEAAE